MDLIELNQQIALAGTEIQSLLGGKRASATRARKNLLQIKKQSDSLRRKVLEYSKNSKAEAKSAKEIKEVTCKEVKVKEALVAAALVAEPKEEKPQKKLKGRGK
jgi:phage/plasmid-associated DNA primase